MSAITQNDYIAVLPLLILGGTGMIVLMIDAFEKKPSRVPLWVSLVGALAAGISGYLNLGNSGRAFGGLIFNTPFSQYFSIVFSIAVILAVLLAERYLEEEEILIGEFSGLVLFAACGMIMLASGADLIITFLG